MRIIGKPIAVTAIAHVEPIRILVADDHPVVRYGVVNLLNAEKDLRVVGEAKSCVDACARAAELQPDVVVLDLEMEDVHGAEALQRFRQVCPDVKVIVFTGHDEDWRVVESLKAGLQGFVMKQSSGETLCTAIRAVAEGGSYLDPSVASKMVGHFGRQRNGEPSTAVDQLTKREITVLRYLADGKRNKEIASKLFITERTVKFHVSSLFSKLGARNRLEAVRIATERGLLHR